MRLRLLASVVGRDGAGVQFKELLLLRLSSIPHQQHEHIRQQVPSVPYSLPMPLPLLPLLVLAPQPQMQMHSPDHCNSRRLDQYLL